jgi:hypothetical protein
VHSSRFARGMPIGSLNRSLNVDLQTFQRVSPGTAIAMHPSMCTIHTKIAADADVTVYRRVDEHIVEVSVVADHELTCIIVDHGTAKEVCGPTEEQTRRNLRRVRASEPSLND